MSETNEVKSPQTLDELCEYIEQHASAIYVREIVGGEHGSYALTDLPPALAIHHALMFIRKRRLPVRVLKPELLPWQIRDQMIEAGEEPDEEGLTEECQNCGRRFTIDELTNPIPDLEQRVAAGEIMPSGECPVPDCRAVCHTVTEEE